METATKLFCMLAVHAFCDFGLQSREIQENKCRGKNPQWPMWLAAHALIHGGAVFFATWSLGFAVAETILHPAIDMLKIEGRISVYKDQLLHVLCKVVYVLL